MPLPRLQVDFNTSSLNNLWTLNDLAQQGITLQEGMRCIFYDLDAEDGQTGFLHVEGVVCWDAKSHVFRMHTDSDLRFTPGDDLAVLDDSYPHQDEQGV